MGREGGEGAMCPAWSAAERCLNAIQGASSNRKFVPELRKALCDIQGAPTGAQPMDTSTISVTALRRVIREAHSRGHRGSVAGRAGGAGGEAAHSTPSVNGADRVTVDSLMGSSAESAGAVQGMTSGATNATVLLNALVGRLVAAAEGLRDLREAVQEGDWEKVDAMVNGESMNASLSPEGLENRNGIDCAAAAEEVREAERQRGRGTER